MNNRHNIRELFDVLEMEVHLLAEKAGDGENIGKIKAVSLLLEDRVNSLYRQAKWRKRAWDKPETLESKTDSCVCGQPWVYEDTFFGRVFGRCRDEYCFMNVKRGGLKLLNTNSVGVLQWLMFQNNNR